MSDAKVALRKYWPQIKRVVDATGYMEIDVRGGDINGARPKDPANCAVARACARHGHDALICATQAYLRIGQTAMRFTVPQSVRSELLSFDRGGGFQRGTYTLRPPSPSRRIGATPKGRPEGRQTGERKRKAPRAVGLRAPLASR